MRPVSPVSATSTALQDIHPKAADLVWPAYGQSALGAKNYGILGIKGSQSPVPMASTAKVVTALAVLKKKPLKPGEQGPLITITNDDVSIYNSYLAQGGSVIPVSVGQRISEYQALEALLLPSANNIADTLVSWAFGSIGAYATYANEQVKSLGAVNTKITEASGFSAKTLSTAQDLVNIGLASMDEPVISEIVKKSEASFGSVGTIKNTNWLLNSDGVIGIKTGNTDQAGGCFLFASKRTVAGQNIILVGAILGAPDLTAAMRDSRSLILSSDSGFNEVTVVKKDQVVGVYKTPWGNNSNIAAKDELKILTWSNSKISLKSSFKPAQIPAVNNSEVGNIRAETTGQQKTAAAILQQPIVSPPWTWRLLH